MLLLNWNVASLIRFEIFLFLIYLVLSILDIKWYSLLPGLASRNRGSQDFSWESESESKNYACQSRESELKKYDQL